MLLQTLAGWLAGLLEISGFVLFAPHIARHTTCSWVTHHGRLRQGATCYGPLTAQPLELELLGCHQSSQLPRLQGSLTGPVVIAFQSHPYSNHVMSLHLHRVRAHVCERPFKLANWLSPADPSSPDSHPCSCRSAHPQSGDRWGCPSV